MPDDFAVSLTDVSVAVPSRRILQRIDLQIPYGSRAAVLGPNGSGKSTLLKAMTAYGHITSGTARILGETLGRTEVHRLRRRMGIVDPSLVRLLDRNVTAQRLVATGFFGHLTALFDRPGKAQLEQAAAVLVEVGLGDHLDQTVMSLSSGQRSRVWLARALVHQPQMLILDEPTADLDLLGRETLLATLDEMARERPALTVITVTHHLEDLLPDTQQILLLKEGRTLAAGTPERVLTTEMLSRAFDCDVRVEKHDGRWRWSVSRHTWPHLAGK